jgi:membrane carboxypeptidase/penicillin-binding protein
MDQDPVAQSKSKSKLNLTGATAALPVWVSYMKQALSEDAPAVFNPNPLIVNLSIDIRSGRLAQNGCPMAQVTTEKFLKDFQPTSFSCEALWPASVRETNAP